MKVKSKGSVSKNNNNHINVVEIETDSKMRPNHRPSIATKKIVGFFFLFFFANFLQKKKIGEITR